MFQSDFTADRNTGLVVQVYIKARLPATVWEYEPALLTPSNPGAKTSHESSLYTAVFDLGLL